MTKYRAYRIRDFELIGEPAVFEAENDDVAIAEARKLEGPIVQIWESHRFVTLLHIGHTSEIRIVS